VATERVLDEAPSLQRMTLVQRREDGALVREVLVDGTDTDARDLRNSVGGDGVAAAALQELHGCIQHQLNGVLGALLPGLSDRELFCFLFHKVTSANLNKFSSSSENLSHLVEMADEGT
jgi:hypothetical protein